jgi:hypothetical protein
MISPSNGVVLYEGPSMIDKKPIVVIATGLKRGSGNAKTGGMIQTHILRADMDPIQALATGADVSICGGCRHRPKETNVIRHRKDGSSYLSYSGRSCYVNVSQAPLTVWRAWKRGAYPTVATSKLAELFDGRIVRLGSYGDPAAVPPVIWQCVVSRAEGYTGYTHQWKSARLREVTQWCQASADSEEEVQKARALGLGTFRVKSASDVRLPGEIVCPASAEAGKVATCETCRMCDGSAKRLNVVIDAHGIGAVNFAKQEEERRQRRTLAVVA